MCIGTYARVVVSSSLLTLSRGLTLTLTLPLLPSRAQQLNSVAVTAPLFTVGVWHFGFCQFIVNKSVNLCARVSYGTTLRRGPKTAKRQAETAAKAAKRPNGLSGYQSSAVRNTVYRGEEVAGIWCSSFFYK